MDDPIAITVAVTGPAVGMTRDVSLLVRKVLEDYAGLRVSFRDAAGAELKTPEVFIDCWNRVRRNPLRWDATVTLEEHTRG